MKLPKPLRRNSRWSYRFKVKIVFLILILALAIIGSTYFNVRAYNINVMPSGIKGELTARILEFRPKMDPVIAEAIAEVLVEHSPPLSPWLMLWLTITESDLKLYAKSHKGAKGLAQLMDDTMDGLAGKKMKDYERYHLIPQVGLAKEELLSCYEKKGTVRGMLDCYICGPNAELKKQPKSVKAERDRYAAQIATGYMQEDGRWIWKKRSKEEKDERDQN